jgi:hypothetical protein
MPSPHALEMAVKTNKGFAICGKDVLDKYGDEIKTYRIDSPYINQYAILAWRENDCPPVVESFIESIPAI